MMVVSRQEERRAKMAGTCVIADGKSPNVGHLGKVTGYIRGTCITYYIERIIPPESIAGVYAGVSNIQMLSER